MALTWTVGGTPTAVTGKANTWRYTVSGPTLPSTVIVTVKFISASVTAVQGTTPVGVLLTSQEQFYVFVPSAETPKPGPVASLTVTSMSVQQLNAQGYIDVTYTSLPATAGSVAEPILKSAIEVSVAPFTITGPLGDLAVDANGKPIIVGTPLLISGASATATSVTYRYFLKDKNPNNTLGLFTVTSNSPPVSINLAAGTIKSGTGTAATANGAQTLTLALVAGTVGESTTNKPMSLGPLTLQNPTVGLGGFGFADGKVVLSVTLGVQKASLAFGGSTTGTPSTAVQG